MTSKELRIELTFSSEVIKYESYNYDGYETDNGYLTVFENKFNFKNCTEDKEVILKLPMNMVHKISEVQEVMSLDSFHKDDEEEFSDLELPSLMKCREMAIKGE